MILFCCSLVNTWNEKRRHTKPLLCTIPVCMLYTVCVFSVSCALCFLSWHCKPIFHGNNEHLSSYCNSYNNITCAAAPSDNFVLASSIWLFWHGAIMQAKSRIKGAELHMKHFSAQEKECKDCFWKAYVMDWKWDNIKQMDGKEGRMDKVGR